MGRYFPPFFGPVAHPFAILGRRRRREMSDPSIYPSNGIRNICTVNRNFIADEEILGNIFLHPFSIPNLLFSGPSVVSDAPHLKRGLLHRLAKGGGGK
jgi:hypothetical protein